MPDRTSFDASRQHYSYRALARQADIAQAEGDEERCIELIQRLYKMLEDKLPA